MSGHELPPDLPPLWDDDEPPVSKPNGKPKRKPKLRLVDPTAGTPRPPPDDRPEIIVGPDLHRVVDQAVAALAEGDPEAFQRDGRLVRVVLVADIEATSERMTAGTPQIRTLPVATLRERLTSTARYLSFDGRSGDFKEKPPPSAVVAAVDARGEWDGIRPIAGIIETPSMRPDGTILDTPGHDAATGFVYAPQREYPPIPAEPTIDDARAALTELEEPWQDFPFAGEADRVVPVAATLTLVARPAIRGACPGFILDKSTRGSGATLMARAITTIAHGREAALIKFPGHDDELEKILGGYALRGASVIVWDNIETTFGGAALDKTLTCADRTEFRVLGVSDVVQLSWRAVMLGTGNNTVIGRDATRRVLVGRLEPMMENPEERTEYQIEDLIAWCRDHHPRLVRAALVLLRAYIVAGRQKPNPTLAGWGSFEAWRDLIAAALVWAGAPDIMATRPTIAGADDSDTAALRTIVEVWPLLAPEGATVSSAIGALWPTRHPGEPPPSGDGFDDLREALLTLAPARRPGDPPAAQKLGCTLNRYRRRVVGRHYLDHAPSKTRSNVQTWIVREVARG